MIHAAYGAAGALLLAMALRTLGERRWGTGAFWAVLGVLFAFGSLLPYAMSGVLVLTLVGLDGFGQVRPGPPGPPPLEPRPGVLLPVLSIPLTTFAIAYGYRLLGWDASQGAVVGLAVGALVGMAVALALFRASLGDLLDEGRRLNDLMGAVSILPQLLASLGVILASAGIGTAMARMFPPQGHWAWLAILTCASMALLTMLLGNSFAAFPVVATGLFFPLLVVPYGLDPALAIWLLTSGSTGTLITPMAANFNLVPPALLGMKDAYGVIKFQMPFALAMGVAHALLLIGFIAWSRA